MKPASAKFQQLRTIVDIGLVVVLLVILISRALPAQAQPVSADQQSVPIAMDFAMSADLESAGANPSPTVAELDDETIAAIIAAENAALNPPQFLADLPMIIR